MLIGHCKEIQKTTFQALVLHRSELLARNASFRISLRGSIHIINPVDKTKVSSKMLDSISLIYRINVFIINSDLVFQSLCYLQLFCSLHPKNWISSGDLFRLIPDYVIFSSIFFSDPWRVPGEVGENRLQTSQISSEGLSISKSAKLHNMCSNLWAAFKMGRLLWYSLEDVFCSIPDGKPLFLSL